MTFYDQIVQKSPQLKRKLSVARIEKTPVQYVKQNFNASLLLTIIATFGAGLFFLGFGWSLYWLLPLAFIMWYALFNLLMHVADVAIRKYAKEIDKDVLFAGRFLMIKLNSGKPLINAIVDASNSYGVASGYFKHIVKDIELGTPLEEALDKASRYCPSEKMRRILFQISNALKIGVDVTHFLSAILDEIAQDQLLEIQKYGRKLSGLTMFYMLFAVVVPSLGITLGITVVSLVNFHVDFGAFIVILFMLLIVELVFISIFKSVRPNVNI